MGDPQDFRGQLQSSQSGVSDFYLPPLPCLFYAHLADCQLHLDAVTYNAGSENVALLALVTRLHQTTLRL
jgi:hypothetical protein